MPFTFLPIFAIYISSIHHKSWCHLAVGRFNGDQVPLPFVCAATETYEEKGAKRVWIAQMEEGMTKRFCTLHLVFRAEGNQPKPTIIFRGQGLRLTRLEKESWDPRVNVMFQKKNMG